jgi:deoxyribodipyrimidine photo-lyase
MILFIHRKDLRLTGLPGLEYIAKKGGPSIHVVILDPRLIANGRHEQHSGKQFLQSVVQLQQTYMRAGKRLHVLYGEPVKVIAALAKKQAVGEIVFHEDVTPYAKERDRAIRVWAQENAVTVTSFSDLTLCDFDALHAAYQRPHTQPYKVFTPFYRKWKEWVNNQDFATGPTTYERLETLSLEDAWCQQYAPPFALPSCEEHASDRLADRLEQFILNRLVRYAQHRDDYVGEWATSGLSAAVNVGVLSVREIYRRASGRPDAESWLRQWAWREFYLYQAQYDPYFFRYEQEYDLSLLTDRYFEAWTKGETGIPLVDAAMTELKEIGTMHNRLRMVVAMFLSKNLCCPFTRGEAYFREKLADYDHVQNRGGWLWSSSLGYDAAPYFRIMNPVLQSQKFDPTGAYIRRWLPAMRHMSDRMIHQPSAQAIVDVTVSRAEAIRVYKRILRAEGE